MARQFMSAREWFEMKTICGLIYQQMLDDESIEDDLYFAVLKYVDLPANTVCDYYLFGSCQYKMVTLEITLLYNDSKEVDKRQIYLYPTPSKYRPYIPKK